MDKKKYLKIVKHYEDCLNKFGDNHRGVDWPNEKDVYLRYDVMLGLVMEKKNVSLLDFGCGAAHLYEYINENRSVYSNIEYSGLDLSQKFISLSKDKFPNIDFYCTDILKDDISTMPNFDYAILNGVFTEKRELSFEEMWDFFQEIMINVFEKVNKGVAFNVMSKAVDWERDDLFHLSIDLLIDFMTKKMSRNFVIKNDYGLYEYTVYLYK